MPAESVQGMGQLRRRLKALADKGRHRQAMTQVGLLAVRYGKQNVHKRTANLSRTIRMGRVTNDSVEIQAGGTRQVGYAVFEEKGTRPHIIRPRRGMCLRFAPNAGDRRATGSPRSGAVRAGRVVYARVVHHPGTRPHPYLLPAARKASRDAGFRQWVVRTWNRAA